MDKSIRLALGGTGLVAIALTAILAQANSAQYAEISTIELDMANAAVIASEAVPGRIIEAEIELEGMSASWEFDIVNESDRVLSVEVDAHTGDVLSIEHDDDEVFHDSEALSLQSVIDRVSAVEAGVPIEAELEYQNENWVWEVETLASGNEQKELRINATNGEIIK